MGRKKIIHVKYFETVAKTVSLRKQVVDRLESLAKKRGVSFSKIVDEILWSISYDDVAYYDRLKHHHAMKMSEADYMLKRARDLKEREMVVK